GEIARRHDTLRTRFVPDPAGGGRPVQVVDPPRPFALPLADLGALPAPRREAEVRRLAAEEALRPFDLAPGPILRALAVRLTPPLQRPSSDSARHALLFTMHHIASDGWSSGILVSEVTQIYPALAAGLPTPLADPSIRYSVGVAD